jgi:hypothetical protein
MIRKNTKYFIFHTIKKRNLTKTIRKTQLCGKTFSISQKLNAQDFMY